MDQALNVADAAASTDGARMALLGMDIAELEAAVTGAGLQKFRARQLWRWVWRHGLTSFEEMSDLGKPVRQTFSCLLYTSPSPRDHPRSRMPSSA